MNKTSVTSVLKKSRVDQPASYESETLSSGGPNQSDAGGAAASSPPGLCAPVGFDEMVEPDLQTKPSGLRKEALRSIKFPEFLFKC